MGCARFRYALEPVALQRQWALDALMRELSERNFTLAQRRAACDAVRTELALAGAEWRAVGRGGQAVSVDRYALLSRFVTDRQRQLQTMEQAVAALELERDGVIEQTALARRAVDAVEQHRERMRGEFIKARLSGEFKSADDHWSALQAGRTQHGAEHGSE